MVNGCRLTSQTVLNALLAYMGGCCCLLDLRQAAPLRLRRALRRWLQPRLLLFDLHRLRTLWDQALRALHDRVDARLSRVVERFPSSTHGRDLVPTPHLRPVPPYSTLSRLRKWLLESVALDLRHFLGLF